MAQLIGQFDERQGHVDGTEHFVAAADGNSAVNDRHAVDRRRARRLLAAEFKEGDTIRVDVSPDAELTFNGTVEPVDPAARASAAPGASPSTVH